MIILNRVRQSTLLFLIALIVLMQGSEARADFPELYDLFFSGPGQHASLMLDSTTAEILADDALTPYDMAVMTRPAHLWRLSLHSNLTANQSAYTGNWDVSEQGTFAWTAYVNGSAERDFYPYTNSRNTLKLAFGHTHQQDNVNRSWSEPVSSVDRIDIESILRFTLGYAADPFTAVQIQSAFIDTRDPNQIHAINPLLVTESAGIARVVWRKPEKQMLVRAGFALRQNWDRNAITDTVGTISRGARFTYDGGLQTVADMKLLLLGDRVTYTGRISVYQALFYSPGDTRDPTVGVHDWKMPDLDIESTFTTQVTRLINVSLFMWWRYDKEVSRAGRLKQTLALGLGYTII